MIYIIGAILFFVCPLVFWICVETACEEKLK